MTEQWHDGKLLNKEKLDIHKVRFKLDGLSINEQDYETNLSNLPSWLTPPTQQLRDFDDDFDDSWSDSENDSRLEHDELDPVISV